jgi:hypothetical protein
MQKYNHLDQRIAELAAFLDPIAFQHNENHSFAERREAAW